MQWNRKLFPAHMCEGPLGFPMREEIARAVEVLLKNRPQGKEWEYRRTFAEPVGADFVESERADVSTITSSTIDRDGEVVLPDGIDLTSFQKNPVVTFGHRYDLLPVGRAIWIKREGDKIKAKTRYSSRPPDWSGEWLPDAVWHMVRMGDLRGKSIGFFPLEGGAPTPVELTNYPQWKHATWIYRKVLLLEYAVATVQSNPDALVEAISKGMIAVSSAKELGLQAFQVIRAERGRLVTDFRGRFRTELAKLNLSEIAAAHVEKRLGRV